MTEYEMGDLAASQVTNMLAFVSVMQTQLGSVADGIQQFMTILFGYIAAAYIAGGRMGNAQVWILSILYVFWQIWLISAIGVRGVGLSLLVERFVEFGGEATVVTEAPDLLRPVSIALLLAALAASLYFMWTVRHPKSE